MKPVTISWEAEQEINESIHFYDLRRPGLGERFVLAIQDAIAIIRNDPLRHKPKKDGTRHCLIKGFPFWVHYLDQPEEIWIVAVAHTSRKPGYWQDRF